MSENKHADNDPERTLVTLEQLSQTIEVMTSVVNRLRQHLSEQLRAQAEMQQTTVGVGEGAQDEARGEPAVDASAAIEQNDVEQNAIEQKRESFVVEIRQHEELPVPKNDKTLH